MIEKKEEKKNNNEEIKKQISQVKKDLENLNILITNCENIKKAKTLIIAENDPDKKENAIFKFAISGDIVLSIMNIVDNFIDDLKNKLIEKQTQLLEKLNELL